LAGEKQQRADGVTVALAVTDDEDGLGAIEAEGAKTPMDVAKRGEPAMRTGHRRDR